MFDTRTSTLNETTVAQLLQRNQRIVLYTSPSNFSSSSPYALDGCTIDNVLIQNLDSVPDMMAQMSLTFAAAANIRAADKAKGSLFLTSLSGSGPGDQLLFSFLLTFLPIDADGVRAKCASEYGIANFTWCPMTLLDEGLLTNFYNQAAMEAAVTTAGFDMPGAIYLDAMDVNGTIRTGTALFGPMFPGYNQTAPHASTRYAYTATMLFATANRLCVSTGPYAALHTDPVACKSVTAALAALRAEYPLTRWEDASTGRHVNWP
jgi:hypothetical protein